MLKSDLIWAPGSTSLVLEPKPTSSEWMSVRMYHRFWGLASEQGKLAPSKPRASFKRGAQLFYLVGDVGGYILVELHYGTRKDHVLVQLDHGARRKQKFLGEAPNVRATNSFKHRLEELKALNPCASLLRLMGLWFGG